MSDVLLLLYTMAYNQNIAYLWYFCVTSSSCKNKKKPLNEWKTIYNAYKPSDTANNKFWVSSGQEFNFLYVREVEWIFIPTLKNKSKILQKNKAI